MAIAAGFRIECLVFHIYMNVTFDLPQAVTGEHPAQPGVPMQWVVE